MNYRIGIVANIAGVSVRTLHHYDDIGLVVPSGRSRAGYRLYTLPDLERLQQVLFFRELGLPLEQIGRLLLDPMFDRRTTLLEHRERLMHEVSRTSKLLDLVIRTLASIEEGKTMKTEDLFNGFDPSQYEDEARTRWGGGDLHKEASRRMKDYSPAELAQMRMEADETSAALVVLMQQGVAATDSRATSLAENHRLHLEKWCYPCSHEHHVLLGEMYVSDTRFTVHYDKLAEGLATYLCEAIRANRGRPAITNTIATA